MTDPGISVLAAILACDQVREVIAEPRTMPRQVREYVAEIVARELILGEHYGAKDTAPVARALGPMYHIYLAARQTNEWARLRGMAGRDRTIALFCVRAALTALFEAFDELAKDRVNGQASAALASFESMLGEAMALWGRETGKSDKYAGQMSDFDSCDGAEKLMSDLAQEYCVPRIAAFLGQMEADSDAIELLSLLYPGRLWDRGIAEVHEVHLGHIREYAEIASHSDELRQVIDIIGRQSADENPGKGPVAACSRSEMHSVITSADLQYMLPSELVKLRDPTLKYLFLARWTEGKLLTYHLSGKASSLPGEERPKGPIVALVDTSGSMSGSPETLAKAVVLATAGLALKSRRDMRVIIFSSTGQTKAIDLSVDRKMADEFLDFLRQRFGGGTDFDTALAAGVNVLKETLYEHADLLFVTDGLAKMTDERLLEEWEQLRERQTSRVFTVVVGSDNAGGLEEISDCTFVLEASPAGTMRLTPR